MKKFAVPSLSLKKLAAALGADIAASLLIGASIVVFAQNADFAPGGVNGMGLILNHLTGLPIGQLILMINVPLVLVCFRFLGVRFFLASLKTMLISSWFIDHVAVLLPAYHGSHWLAAVFSGLFAGAGFALVYLQNSSTGGTDFLIMTGKKLRPSMSIGQLTQLLDGSVIIAGAFVLRRTEAVLLGLVYTVVCSLCIDLVMRVLGPRADKCRQTCAGRA
ncbi:MAG: YitT family protein [Pyramidobacter sp.]|nr:YitT family protein [Pyramidobacter sp.]